MTVKVLFFATDPTHGTELWVTDGSFNIALVKDIDPGSANSVSAGTDITVPERFTYYHVELDDHSLLLAENTPAETFVDNVDRRPFDNWAEHEALYPEGKPIVEMPYPRAKAARQVPRRIRLQLDARAARLYAALPAVA